MANLAVGSFLYVSDTHAGLGFWVVVGLLVCALMRKPLTKKGQTKQESFIDVNLPFLS